MCRFKKMSVPLMVACLLATGLAIGSISQAAAGDSPTTVVWGTASLGSSAQMVASAIGSVISNNEPTLRVSVQATGGGMENPRLLNQDQINIAHLNTPHAASHGIGAYQGEDPIELWALFNMYSNEYVICVLDESPIKTIEDLVGKKMSVGPPGSGTKNMSKSLLDAYGIYDQIKVSSLGYSASVDALKDGVVDAIAQFVSAASIPNSALQQLDLSTKYRILPMSEKALNIMFEKNPDFAGNDIQPEALKALTKPLPSFAVFSSEFANSKMSDETAYKIVKTLYEHLPELSKYHQLATKMKLENALKGIPKDVPVHPGAARYYKEKGVWRDDLTIGVRK